MYNKTERIHSIQQLDWCLEIRLAVKQRNMTWSARTSHIIIIII